MCMHLFYCRAVFGIQNNLSQSFEQHVLDLNCLYVPREKVGRDPFLQLPTLVPIPAVQ